MSASKNTAHTDAFQEMLLQLRKSFVEEMPEKLDRLEHLLLEMEKNGADEKSFHEFYRIAYSLKGNSGTHVISP